MKTPITNQVNLIKNQEIFDKALKLVRKMFKPARGQVGPCGAYKGGITRNETDELISLQKQLTSTEKAVLQGAARAINRQ